MTLVHRIRALYEGSSPVARAWAYGLLITDIVIVVYVIVSSFFLGSEVVEIIDIVLGVLIALEFSARLYISRSRWRMLWDPTALADIVVILSLLAPIAGEGFAFLRVVRTFRLLRSYRLLKQLRRDFLFFRQNEATVFALTNLALFIFVTTAVVYETQHSSNADIGNYADALYFTVTTLTTTGFGDVTLPGVTGRLLSIGIMIFGVSLFVRLIQVLFRPPKIDFECPDCGLSRHDPDAIHCKHCGRVIHIVSQGAD